MIQSIDVAARLVGEMRTIVTDRRTGQVSEGEWQENNITAEGRGLVYKRMRNSYAGPVHDPVGAASEIHINGSGVWRGLTAPPPGWPAYEHTMVGQTGELRIRRRDATADAYTPTTAVIRNRTAFDGQGYTDFAILPLSLPAKEPWHIIDYEWRFRLVTQSGFLTPQGLDHVLRLLSGDRNPAVVGFTTATQMYLWLRDPNCVMSDPSTFLDEQTPPDVGHASSPASPGPCYNVSGWPWGTNASWVQEFQNGEDEPGQFPSWGTPHRLVFRFTVPAGIGNEIGFWTGQGSWVHVWQPQQGLALRSGENDIQKDGGGNKTSQEIWHINWRFYIL